jgi:hypothetical protein
MSLPVGKKLRALQSAFCEMMADERKSGIPLEPRQLTIAPNEYDIQLTDISEGDIQQIQEILGTPNLQPVEGIGAFPVEGIMYGQNLRIFVPLVVATKKKVINVNFLFDTGSPVSYLRRETFEALGFSESIPSEVLVRVHGVTAQVHLSHGHFENVDIVGQDYLRVARICATLNYDLLTVSFDTRFSYRPHS